MASIKTCVIILASLASLVAAGCAGPKVDASASRQTRAAPARPEAPRLTTIEAEFLRTFGQGGTLNGQFVSVAPTPERQAEILNRADSPIKAHLWGLTDQGRLQELFDAMNAEQASATPAVGEELKKYLISGDDSFESAAQAVNQMNRKIDFSKLWKSKRLFIEEANRLSQKKAQSMEGLVATFKNDSSYPSDPGISLNIVSTNHGIGIRMTTQRHKLSEFIMFIRVTKNKLDTDFKQNAWNAMLFTRGLGVDSLNAEQMAEGEKLVAAEEEQFYAPQTFLGIQNEIPANSEFIFSTGIDWSHIAVAGLIEIMINDGARTYSVSFPTIEGNNTHRPTAH